MKEIGEIKEIQSILYDALCYFDDFCRQNDIQYVLSNGTLLGAAKYGDFVPWDDDVDLIMPRDDLNRFVRFANKAASITTSRPGAIPAMPNIREVEEGLQ